MVIPDLDRLGLSKHKIDWFSCIMLADIIVGAILFLFGVCTKAYPAEVFTDEQLADAIYKAENSKSHPYGILAHYKHTTPRQACLNTIKSAKRRFIKQSQEKDFIHFLSLTYCPIGCDNDNGTNRFWERNVKYFLKNG